MASISQSDGRSLALILHLSQVLAILWAILAGFYNGAEHPALLGAYMVNL